MYEKVNREVDVFDWTSGMKFGHLLLPRATAEVSSKADKGMTRLCFPFVHASGALDHEGDHGRDLDTIGKIAEGI